LLLQQSQLSAGEAGEMGEQMYQLKTMCLAKKTVQMPTKEEHGFLLFCGLGEYIGAKILEEFSPVYKEDSVLRSLKESHCLPIGKICFLLRENSLARY
jgi:hypothetical protein